MNTMITTITTEITVREEIDTETAEGCADAIMTTTETATMTVI